MMVTIISFPSKQKETLKYRGWVLKDIKPSQVLVDYSINDVVKRNS